MVVAAVSPLVWAVFGVVIAFSLALLGRTTLLMIRRLKEFKTAAEDATAKLNAAMGEVNDLLRQANEGMTKVSMRRLRDR